MALIDFSALTPEERRALFNGPAMEAPEGQESNLEHPPNDNVTGHAVLAVLTLIVFFSAGNRFYSNFILGRPYIADYFMLVTLALYIGLITLVYLLMDDTGIFVHQWNFRLGNIADYLKYTHHTATVFSTLMGFLKAAILIDWIRIFVPTGTRNFMFWGCVFFIFINTGFSISMVITNNVACVPYEYNWNKLIEGNCNRINTAQTNLGSAVFNFLMDVFVFFLPQRVIWQLHMSTKKRFAVSLVFMVGIAAIVATAVRLGITVANVNSEDYTYTFSAVMLCALGETVCGFLVLCGPTFPKVGASIAQSKLVSSVRSWSILSSKRTRVTEGSTGHSVKNMTPRNDYYARIEEGNRPIPLSTVASSIGGKFDGDSQEHFNVQPQKPHN